ncbi:MAG TPA: exonuclease SbcCD subunit D [Vicinamibacteria bacterium]|nr:exonuclease SbcCD subunit D [Vicinamibacteria bacterium]
MRFLHTGDWHVGKTLRGRSRADEHRAVLGEIVAIAREAKVDVALIAGDLFDSPSPSPESEEIVYRTLLDLARVVEWVVVISGNHDNPRRLAAVEPLLRLTNIRVLPSIARPSEGGVITLQTRLGGAQVALLPFLSQRAIVKADDLMMKDASQHVGDYAERAARIIEALSAESPPPRTVNILLAHAMVHGGKLGGGERSAHTIFEYGIPTTAFPGAFHYVALGHLHRAQKLAGACPIWYAGSPLQLDFGETEDVKSVNLVDAEPSSPARVESVRLTSGRRLRFVRAKLEELETLATELGDAYLKVVIAHAPVPGLAQKVRDILPNAVDVLIATKTEEPKPSASRIGRTPRELFSDYLDEHGGPVPELLSLFDELLDEVYATD